jgi:two-component system, sensor histidine kinase and response regulator
VNAEATSLSPEESLADLRHKLRTPLNHIIGYSELLLGELTEEAEATPELRTVWDCAQVILGLIRQCLSPDAAGSADEKTTRLRAAIEAPVTAIAGTLGPLAGHLRGTALLDLLRINLASIELLAFAQGEGEPRLDFAARFSEPKSHESALPDVARASPALSSSSRILAVDDDEANTDMLSRQLSRYGHVAAGVESGEAALQALREQDFDLVLLDVMMPEMSGIEVLKEIKSNPQLAGIPVIMISALDELEGAARCIEMGAEDYLLKPVDPVLLRARVHSALERNRLHEAEKDRTRALEKASQDLKRANEDLNSFAFAASHDLQEPLRTITTTLQLLNLHLEEQLTGEQRELIQLASDGALRMKNLISDLLSYSLANSQNRSLEHVTLESALDEALINLRQAMEESGASVTRGAVPYILGDRAQLVPLFQNLIGNAIKYRSERPPRVHVSCENRADHWIISVEDNGMGIEEQYLQTIFQPFRRLHGSNLPGTGLGLAICERIVEGFGGRIWVESETGVGSVFYFTVGIAR